MEKKYSFYQYVLLGFFLLFTAILVHCSVADVLTVSGPSMEPALHSGQHVVLNRLAYGFTLPFSQKTAFRWKNPAVNDVVVFYKDNHLVIKRCAAISGQTLEFCTESEYSFSVGNQSESIRISSDQYEQLKDCTPVPEGFILVLGDNRSESIDSRQWGLIPVNSVLGKAACR